MKSQIWQAVTRTELIIEVWESLDCDSVGGHELTIIQDAVGEKLGPGAVTSPAAIARVLADEGAVLRHPEILNCDTKWREQQQTDLVEPENLNFANLTSTRNSLETIGRIYSSAAREGDQVKLKRLSDLILQYRQEAQLVSKSKVVSEQERVMAKEIAHWLAVWLQQPELFYDWLVLRQRSADYQKQFSDF